MKKIIFLAIAFVLPINIFAQNTLSPNTYWQEHFVKKIKTAEGLSYQRNIVYEYPPKKDTILLKIGFEIPKNNYFDTINISKDTIEILQKNISVCLTEDSMKVIDWENRAMSYGAKKPDSTIFEQSWNPFGSILYPRYVKDLNSYAPFYLDPSKVDSFKVDFLKMYDTIMNNIQYKALFTIKLVGYSRPNEDSEWKPYFDTITYFCNKSSDLVEKIHIHSGLFAETRYYYNFKNISLKKQILKASTTFDYNQSKYKNFEKYNFNLVYVHPSLYTIGWSKNGNFQDSIISDEILNIPFLNCNKDTVYLKNFKNWVLLDFWTFGCSPCASFHQQLKKEHDSLGYRFLEHQGIKIFCINTYKNFDKLKKYGNLFDINDISYYADYKICKLFDFHLFPKYYLYSPEGNLVFEGYVNPNDYSPLLKAKADYEKQHNLKP